MTQFLTLLKMEFKNKRQALPLKNKFLNLFFKAFLFLLKNFVFISILVFLTNYLMQYAKINTLENDFLIAVISFTILLEFFITLSQVLKQQQKVKEVKEILLVPVKNETLYISRILFFYIKHIATITLTLLPVLITWGYSTSQSSAYFWSLIPVVLLLPVVPILLASLLGFPLFKVVSFLKAHFYINFIIFVCVIAVGFYYYIEILKVMISFFENQGSNATLSLTEIAALQNVTSKFYISVLFKNILTGLEVFKSLLVLFTISFATVVAGHFLAKKYFRILMWRAVDSEISYGRKNTKIKKVPLVLNLLIKEFKTVFRNHNHSFSFFTIALSTPLIVFLSSAVLSEFSFAKTNFEVYAPISLFLLLIFMSLPTSFSATTITREARSFMVAKVLPVSAKTQIKIKILFYIIVEFLAVFVSVIALGLSNLISALDALFILLLVLTVIYASVCSGISTDIKNPLHKDVKNLNTSLANINVSKNMSSGLMVAFLLGFFAITLSLIFGGLYWYIPVAVFSATYAALNHYKLFKNLNQKHHEIEI